MDLALHINHTAVMTERVTYVVYFQRSTVIKHKYGTKNNIYKNINENIVLHI